jgi:hypothetical protein
MTKNEREYLEMLVRTAAERADAVHNGQMHADVYKTEDERRAFAQGVWDLNQVLETFIGARRG